MPSAKDRVPCKRYREIFMLVEVNGLSAEDAAKQLGIKPKSVTDVASRVRTWMQRNGGQWSRCKENERRIDIVRELYAARLEHQWKMVMSAWYASVQPHQREKIVFEEGKEPRRSEVIRSSQTGNVRYLMQAVRLLDKICALRQGDVQSLSQIKEYSDVRDATIAERRTELTELLRLYGPGARAASGGGTAEAGDAAAQSSRTLRAA